MCPKVTEEYKQTIREKILQSAEALFANKGYHETSMDDIVKESGLSKGAIYGYFESKQELFLALSDRRLASILGKIQSIFSPEDSTIKKIDKAVEITFGPRIESSEEASREACRMNLELWVEAPRIESLQHRLDSRYESVHKFVADIVDEGIKKGEFRQDIDSNALASILLATIDGLSLHWATTGQDFDWQNIKNTLLAVLSEGVLAGKGTR